MPIAVVATIALLLAAAPGPASAAKGEPQIVSPAKPLPAFGLRDHRHAPFANDRFKDKWSLVLLGFTQCPDICPFTLQNLTLVMQQLSLRVSPGRLPQVVFVAVDPDRDAPVLGDYVAAFSPDFIGATGEWPELVKLVEGVEGFARIDKKQGADSYQVFHSAFVAVIDPQGRLAARLNPPMNPDATAAFLSELMRHYAKDMN
jgi:protein SCO1/2